MGIILFSLPFEPVRSSVEVDPLTCERVNILPDGLFLASAAAAALVVCSWIISVSIVDSMPGGVGGGGSVMHTEGNLRIGPGRGWGGGAQSANFGNSESNVLSPG